MKNRGLWSNAELVFSSFCSLTGILRQRETWMQTTCDSSEKPWKKGRESQRVTPGHSEEEEEGSWGQEDCGGKGDISLGRSE